MVRLNSPASTLWWAHAPTPSAQPMAFSTANTASSPGFETAALSAWGIMHHDEAKDGRFAWGTVKPDCSPLLPPRSMLNKSSADGEEEEDDNGGSEGNVGFRRPATAAMSHSMVGAPTEQVRIRRLRGVAGAASARV
jgi:hypothetical protein|eukprot:SAG25_NODE_1034_length_4219_cov_3.886408_3_plen_137_part_00